MSQVNSARGVQEGALANPRILLAAITLSAAAVRLVYAMIPRMARWDEAAHLMVAHNLISGNGYAEMVGKPDVHLPPVLPFLSAGLLRLGLAPEWATAAVHIVTGALLCVPIYALGRAIYGHRTGFIAAVLVALYPALAAWPFVWSTMTESPFLLFVFTGVWAVRKALTTGCARWYAAIGLAFGLAYLTRPEGLIYFAVLGFYMALWHVARRSLLQPGVIAKLALAAGFCLAVMSPYLIYLHNNTGHWTLSGKVGLILDIAPAYLAHDQAAHDLAVSRLDSTGQEIMWFSPERFDKSLAQYVMADPRRFFYQVRQNMAETWLALFHQDLFSPWIVALAALGIFARPWPKGRRWWDEALLWATLLPLASFWAFFVIDRFLIGALPVGLLWAAAGLDHLADWAPASLRAPWPRLGRTTAMTAAALPLALTLAFCLWVTPAQLKAGIDGMPWGNLAAARWLAAETPPDAVVMTRYTEVGLYSGHRLVPSPNASLDEMLAYGRRHGAQYLVVDDWELTTVRPHLSFLLDPAQAPPQLEYLRTFGDGHKTLIYRLRDQHE